MERQPNSKEVWENKITNLMELIKNKNFTRIANQKLQNFKPSEIKAIMEKESDLTFKPKINKVSELIALKKKKYRMEDGDSENMTNFDVIEELYYKDAIRKHKIKKQQELKQEQEDKECTFTPEINNNSRTIRRDAKYYPDNDQYKQIKEDQAYKKGVRDEIQKLNQERKEAEELAECTFHPKINEYNESMFKQSDVPVNFEKEVNRMRYAFYDKMEQKMRLEHIPKGENYEALRNMPMNPPKCSMNYIIRSEEPFLYLDVNIGNNKTGRIGLAPNDDPEEKARSFAITFQLNDDMERGLYSLLTEQLELYWEEQQELAESDITEV